MLWARCKSWNLGLLVWLVSLSAHAAFSEYEVKAAFLCHFGKYVEWPADAWATPQEPVNLCIIGEDVFGPIVDRLAAAESVSGRPLKVIRTRPGAPLPRCHLAFISQSEDGRLPEVLGWMKSSPVLTVSDIDAFAQRGGMIGLRVDAQKVRFEINVAAARQHRLKLSSQLLKLATLIVGQYEGEQ